MSDLLPEVIRIFLLNYGVLSIRYIVFSGIAFWIFWVWKKEKFRFHRIQDKFPDKQKIYGEIKYSFLTFIIFALVGVGIFLAKKNGYTLIYNDVSQYGKLYLFFSIIVSIVVHDTYFYWTHRLMHHKLLFKKFHQVHHNSTNPSPWAAFSFHPYEAVVEAGIVPLLVMIMPMHPIAIVSFVIFMTILNVIGHLGYEFWPDNFTRSPFTFWNNTSTHHNMHHQKYNCNYGLYFNWWDRICNTNHAEYLNEYDRVVQKRKSAQEIPELISVEASS